MNTILAHAETTAPLGTSQTNDKGRSRIFILSACMALQFTGFVMILPLFARRFAEFGAGVEQLATSVIAGAVAGMIAAPFMGAAADRFGRRLIVLASLAVYVLAFAGYLLASSALSLILLRGLAGACTAGLVPAVIGIVSDLAPLNRRAQWIGMVNGGASFGWIAGPILGGVFYDRWGYGAAVIASIAMGLATLVVAHFTIPKTRPRPDAAVEWHPAYARDAQPGRVQNPGSTWTRLLASLPGALPAFIALLSVSCAVMLAWAFIEPSFMFYAYDGLGWDSSMLGLVMSTYGIAMMLGEFGLSRLSDSLGRKPVIVAGLVLFAAQFVGLAFFRNYIWISASFVIAGLGNALFDPALSAAIMDMTRPEHQARIQGIKSTAGSLGTILGPALAILFTPLLGPQSLFLMAVGIVLVTTLVGLLMRL